MKYLKLFEEFTGFQLDEISKKEYYSILDNNRLVYIPESKVLEFKSKLSKEYKLGYGRASIKDTVEFFRIEYETEIDYHITSKRFSIKKKSLGADEPYYTLLYEIENHSPADDEERLKQYFFTFEEDDYDEICNDPKILIDYLNREL